MAMRRAATEEARWYIWELTLNDSQRNASTQSEGAASSWKNAATLSASTALAVGSCGFYYFQFARPVQAMTPAEEG
jgi:hypothetical protein